MLVAGEHFIRSLVEEYGKHTVYTQMVGGGTWYPETYNFLYLKT
jgi:hypothetical protein